MFSRVKAAKRLHCYSPWENNWHKQINPEIIDKIWIIIFVICRCVRIIMLGMCKHIDQVELQNTFQLREERIYTSFVRSTLSPSFVTATKEKNDDDIVHI